MKNARMKNSSDKIAWLRGLRYISAIVVAAAARNDVSMTTVASIKGNHRIGEKGSFLEEFGSYSQSSRTFISPTFIFDGDLVEMAQETAIDGVVVVDERTASDAAASPD